MQNVLVKLTCWADIDEVWQDDHMGTEFMKYLKMPEVDENLWGQREVQLFGEGHEVVCQ